MSTYKKGSRALIALGFGLLLGFAALVSLPLGYRLRYLGRIYPGVSVGGVDLSGLRPAEAASRLAAALDYPHNGKVVFSDGQQTWLLTPAELGLSLDAAASAEQAFSLGRSQWLGPLRLRRQPVNLPPVLRFDQARAYRSLQSLAAQLDVPPQEALLQREGLTFTARDGQPGRRLNVDAVLNELQPLLFSRRDGLIALQPESLPPAVQDASTAAAAANALLSAPLQLTLPDDGSGQTQTYKIPPEVLADWLFFPRVEGAYQLRLNPAPARAWLEDLAGQIDRSPENARFIFNDDTRELEVIQPSRAGLRLDVEASLEALQQAAAAGSHAVSLVVEIQPPQVDESASAADLGITELVSVQTSYFRGSSGARIQNIQAAAGRFHGLLIPPGGVLSMAEVLEDISLDNGYAEALIIYNGRTIKGVGGGVCQVSTTLFRTAFFGGYPILERNAHAYRVYYYEQTEYGYDPSLAGLDATVYIPLVDFKFKNDTPYWLLMETYVNVGARRLTWKFYSTSDGRQVEWETSGLQNVTPAPEPEFIPNPELPPGKVRQVDWAADGADVTVVRRVYRQGALYLEDVFTTHYQPWRAVCEYAPNIDDPEARARELGLCQP